MALCLWSVPAYAEDDTATRAAARKLAEDGVAALQNGDAATATQKLEKAHQMLKVPSVALWSARALVKRGLLLEAAERLRETVRLPSSGDEDVQAQAKRDAEKELGELTSRIPNLVITTSGGGEPGAVTVDGTALPAALLGEDRPINPGPHHVVAKRGADERAADVTVAEGERKTVTLSFDGAAPIAAAMSPNNAAAPSTDQPTTGNGHKTLTFVAIGAGAVGLVVGGVTGGLALSKKQALDDNPACGAGKCLHSVDSEVSSLRTFRTVSTLGFIAGGVLAATGVVLLVTSSDAQTQGKTSAPRLALGVGPGHLQLLGRF